MQPNISNTQDVIDSRDIIERIEELQHDYASVEYGGVTCWIRSC